MEDFIPAERRISLKQREEQPNNTSYQANAADRAPQKTRRS